MRNRNICCKGSFSGFCIDLGYLFLCVAFFCSPLALAARVSGKQKSKQYQWNSTAVVASHSRAGDWTYKMVSSDIHHPPSKWSEQEVRQRKVSYHWHIRSMHGISSQPVSSSRKLADYPFKTEIVKTQVLMFFLYKNQNQHQPMQKSPSKPASRMTATGISWNP